MTTNTTTPADSDAPTAAGFTIEQGEPLTSWSGGEHRVAAVLYDGQVVATIARRSQHGRDEYVIAGVKVLDAATADQSHRFMRNPVRSTSTPATGTRTYEGEPTGARAIAERQADIEETHGYEWAAYAEEGATRPENASDAFKAGVSRALTGRASHRAMTVTGVLFGKPVTW